ncbi:hypothetical protein RJ640_008720 [Escallonia rubra]|uniref:Uncharacterized protein n=1 Tax=Escallonia rubra TaxID=112253 RepID=A0AA88R686_9ASTE|nr:hypothetical protein RJ640_008720 [Escallonia rubra]
MNTIAAGGGGGDRRSVVVELPLGDSAAAFDLEKAVCSHGLFMMAPNHWDPLSKTLQRPLRLDYRNDSLHLRVFGTDYLSPRHQLSLQDQVRRMLRLSEAEERSVRGFQDMYDGAKERGFGRVFRSPTLFEDMVKWGRTLSMAKALCELQLELQCPSPNVLGAETKLCSPTKAESEHFSPKTPAVKELKKKLRAKNTSTSSTNKIAEATDYTETSDYLHESENMSPDLLSSDQVEDLHKKGDSGWTSSETHNVDSCSLSNLQPSVGTEVYVHNSIGNFPSPRELSSLDENFLAKRCNLGYRASRILSLARSIVDGRIQLIHLEEACSTPSLANYSELADQLKKIDGFGPYTCANVLMCMGSEMYAFELYLREKELMWHRSEVWSFYEETFGKLSEMPHSDYKLITAANMRPIKSSKSKRLNTAPRAQLPKMGALRVSKAEAYSETFGCGFANRRRSRQSECSPDGSKESTALYSYSSPVINSAAIIQFGRSTVSIIEIRQKSASEEEPFKLRAMRTRQEQELIQ